MKKQTPTMKTYTIKIYRDGIHVDTQTVEAENEGQAISGAMAQTRVVFAGAMASYEGREQGEEAFRPFVREF
jgi:hypothetical protein